MSDWPKTAYLFKGGRRERLAGSDVFPSEFFYGLVELRQRGKDVFFFDEAELDRLAGPEGRILWLVSRVVSRFFPGLPFSISAALRYGRANVLRRLNEMDVLIATTQTFGLVMGLLKRLGLVKARLIFIGMGIMPMRMPRRWQRFVAWLLAKQEVAVISEAELEYLSKRLPASVQLGYLPFGIDTSFWTPDCEAKTENYVVSIGNDWNRDFATLVQAWLPEFPKLVIVTQLPVDVCDRTNIEVQNGNWRQQQLSDVEIRQLYRNSLFAVLPLKQTIQPAGQSACLQIMACGKAVILSDIVGLWDRKSLRHRETCLLVSPGSIEQLRNAVRLFLADSALATTLGRQAHAIITTDFTTTHMSNGIERLVTRQDVSG